MVAKNLWFRYGNHDEWTLRNINLSLNKPGFFLFSGPSGSGKTTLARLFMGLIPFFYSGEIRGTLRVLGQNPISEGPDCLFGKVGFLGQIPEMYTIATSVKREIISLLEYFVDDRNELIERFNAVSEKLGISNLLDRNITELSSGELQKVELASILALKPKIIILDEPLSRLDPSSKFHISNILRDIANSGVLTIVFEHHLDYLLPMVDKVFILKRGEIVTSGTPKEVLEALYDVDIPEISEVFIELKKALKSNFDIPLSVEKAIDIIGDIIDNKI
ncbi:MAG: ABC transporter ATP-binding protein [Candidatus Njordarchaeia archaeon]